MNSLTLFFLGLILIYIPTCLSQNEDKQCFSQSLKPSYPCCEGNKIVFTDKDGDWGVEHNKWCGIGNGSSEKLDEFCFSIILGYSCCEKCEVAYTDKDGKWGVEHNKWCGIKDSCISDVEIDPVQNVPKEVEVKDPVQNDVDFDFAFLKIENNKKNVLYSPLSIKYALKMLQEGASNNTYAEINKFIGNTELTKYTTIEKGNEDLIETIMRNSEYSMLINNNNILSIANGLFIRDAFYKYVITEYINTLKEKYDAEIIEDSFESAQNVNQWIEDKTSGIIKNVLSDDVVSDPDIGMLIINTLAIDMEWVVQFRKEDTSGQPFYKDDGEEITATTLSCDGISSVNFSYYLGDDITVLTMDLKKYDEVQLEFMTIMPKENLTAYIENISKEQIDQIDKNLKLATDKIHIEIPKFKFDYDLKLKNDLIELGIEDAFDEIKADFSKMVDLEKLGGNIYVSDALHKTNIEFTEKGVKAAAVTVMLTAGSLGFPGNVKSIDIIIDKPFMFIIRDKNTKNIWFTGTVYEPDLWENDKKIYENPFYELNLGEDVDGFNKF